MKRIVLLSFLFSFFGATTYAADEGFPGRAEFPEIKLYQKEDLVKDLDKVVVVDTRSSLEFETLKINGAINIPVADKKFPDMIKALRKETNKPIVFYCNGRTCYKSYKAAKESLKVGVKNVYAYDAGIFEWAKAYPDKAELLGTSPVDASQIIPKDKLQARFLDPKTFTTTVRGTPRSQTLIMDVRDMYQRAGVGFFPGIEKWVSLDDQQKLDGYLKQALAENRTLFIYDEAGKQVRWLQYTLERANVKNYYFMTKGAKGFYKEFIM